LRQENLMAQSRLPRVWTSAFSQPGFADFSRKLRTCGTPSDTKEVHTKLSKREILPTAVYKIEKPIQETYDTKNNIQNINNINVSSGTRTLDITQQNVQHPNSEINISPLHAIANTNANSDKVFINNNKLNTEKYTHDINTTSVFSNPSTASNYISIEEALDLPELPIKPIHNINYTTPASREEGVKYVHKDLELDKNLPSCSATANINDNKMYKQQKYENTINLDRNIPNGNFETNKLSIGENFVGTRSAKLMPKINAGEYQIRGNLPSQTRIQEIPTNIESEKNRISRIVNNSMNLRNDR